MPHFRYLTSEEIDALEASGTLWVCQSCDAHCDADWVGDVCPACGAEPEDDETGGTNDRA